MSHLPFTLAAYLLNSIAVTVDKFLLSKRIPDPLVYVFYFSCYSLIALLAVPFTHLPSSRAFLLSSASTLLWTLAAYLMFKALQIGQISRVIPIIGTLIPLFLLTEAILNRSITLDQIWAVGILILGIIFLTINDWEGHFSLKELLLELCAGVLFASSYLLLRQAYLLQDFLTVFVWSRLILLPVGAIILIAPSLRGKVLNRYGTKINFLSKTGVIFLVGQAAGGGAELLLTFSISLATPALVNSLQGSQYVFLFLFSLILSKKFPQIYQEHLSKLVLGVKIIGILLIGLGLYLLSTVSLEPKKPDLGITFSPRYAKSLGLDPKKTYLEMLSDLKVRLIRLPLYWEEVEVAPGKYDLFQVDFYLNEAQKKGAKVIPVVGMKVPRWPECFIPKFDQGISTPERQKRTLALLRTEIDQLKDYPSILAWQVENEPLLNYGICPTPDLNFLNQEITLVRSLDPKRPILVTDSGELSYWIPAMQSGDWFGITMYRTVWDQNFGFFDYPLPSFFYQLKYSFANFFVPNGQKALIAELQAEPWAPEQKEIYQLPIKSQLELFPVSKIRQNINYATQSGFSPLYLWGVEWWYYMKMNNHPEYLDQAKLIFQSN